MDPAGRTRNRFSGYFSPRRKHGCARGSLPAMICYIYHPHLPRQYQAKLRSALMCHLTRRSTIFLSTSHIDPWVPSLISSYNGTSQVDVILTADPNRSLTTWESPVGHHSPPVFMRPLPTCTAANLFHLCASALAGFHLVLSCPHPPLCRMDRVAGSNIHAARNPRREGAQGVAVAAASPHHDC